MNANDSVRALEARVRELTAINELIKTLTSTLELGEILRIVRDRFKTLTHAETLSLLLYDGERDELVFAATETLRENAVVGLRVPADEGVSSWVVRTGQGALVNDAANDPRFYSGIDRVSQFATRPRPGTSCFCTDSPQLPYGHRCCCCSWFQGLRHSLIRRLRSPMGAEDRRISLPSRSR